MNLRQALTELYVWFRTASPWLQGLFGGAGATLLWEGLLKPRRERRAIAHVLAEEVALNLQMAAGQLEMFQHNPKSVPQDFRFLTAVYNSIVERVGALPTRLVGDVVLLYAGMEATSRIPDQFAHTLELRDALRLQQGRLQGAGLVAGVTAGAREKDMEFQLATFQSGVEKALERANDVLPRLRRAAVPLWRLDYYWQRKSFLSLAEMKKRVADHARRIGLPIRDHQSATTPDD